MNKTTQLLRSIQVLRLVINPVFFVPLQLNTAGFSSSMTRTAVIACFLMATYATKIYFFTRYKLATVEFYVEMYHLGLITSLSALSYVGYVFNSGSIAKILNSILFQSRPVAETVFCRKACMAITVQLLVAFGVPFSVNIWCNSNPFFFSVETFWLFTVDIWLAFIIMMHLTSTNILFSNAILLCCQTIANVNNELVKMYRIDWPDSDNVQLIKKEKVKVGWINRVDLSEDGLASVISTYNSVCQNCADLNSSYGCSVSCTYISNLTDMILVAYYTVKYGVNELWVFIIINFCYFLNIWFLLFSCESFTKEVNLPSTLLFFNCFCCLSQMRKTGIIVNRLMLETGNQRQKELFQQFSIFLLHRKIKFTAWGLFSLDYKMVYSTLSMAVTYLALVYQFENKYNSLHRGESSVN